MFLLSNACHPCIRCTTRSDRPQKKLASAEYKKLGICINSVKEDNLVRYTQIFENFFLEISVPFVPVLKISKFLVDWYVPMLTQIQKNFVLHTPSQCFNPGQPTRIALNFSPNLFLRWESPWLEDLFLE